MKPKRLKLAMERYFLFEPNVYINLVFTVAGGASPEKIMDAVRKTYTQNQTTMSKAVLDEKGNLYLEEMPQSGCKVSLDSRDWQEIRQEQEHITFRINEGEFLRTFIIPNGETTDVYMMAHHMMCDGSGMVMLVDDIMNNLAGNEVAYKPTIVIKKGTALRKGNLSLKSKVLLRLLNLEWKKERKIFTWDDYYKIHETYWKNKSSYFTMDVINEDELAAIKKECKELNITINSYLVAKILSNYPQCRCLGMPISLRTGERSISNFVANLTTYFDYDTTKTYQENAVALDKITRVELKKEGVRYYTSQFMATMDPTLMDASLMHHVLGYESEPARKMASLVGYFGKRHTELGVSNMRVIDLPSQYGSYKVSNVIGIVPKISSASKVVGVFTFNGKMYIADSLVKEI